MNERPIYKTPPGTRGGRRPGLNRRLGGLACVACVLTLAGATLGNGLVGSSAEIEELAAPAQGVVDSGGNRQSVFSAIRAQIARLAPAIAPAEAEPPTDEAVADAAAFHERIDATEVAAETPPAEEAVEPVAEAAPEVEAPAEPPAPVFACTLTTASAPVAPAPEPPLEGGGSDEGEGGDFEAAALAISAEPPAEEVANDEEAADEDREAAKKQDDDD